MNRIKKQIIEFIKGTAFVEDLQATPPFLSSEFLQLGEMKDADAILIGGKEEGKYFVIGLIGKSVLQGSELSSYLISYFKTDGGLEAHSMKIANHFYDGFQKAENPVLVLRCEDDERWRAFKPLKRVEELELP